MLFTITLLVLMAAVTVLFAEEFGEGMRKILNLPGVMLVGPMVLTSFIILYYQDFFLWFLSCIQYYLEILTALIASQIINTTHQKEVGIVVSVFLTAIIPVLLYSEYIKHKTYRPYVYRYVVAAGLWLTALSLLLLPQIQN